ncbi:extracellular solute-binding protein [Streptomyces sp. NPDC005017]|uniref:extracellular solute-binding protein n=1 Tax=Streptomyces sp. NPDC005017 TaxID=3364706 RepID=UPI0036C256E0
MRTGQRVRARRRIGATSAALALLLLAACTGGPDDGSDSSAPGADDEIVVASGLDVTGENDIRRRLVEAWNDQRGKSVPRARIVELPDSAREQRSQILGALQSGSSRYDVVNLDVTLVPEFAETGLITPLDDTAVAEPDDLIPSVDATAKWRGRRYAVPFNSDVGLLYYRRDFLAAAQAQITDPSGEVTWAHLRSVITHLGQKEPPGYEAGWTTQLDGEGRTVNTIEAFASAVDGLELTDERGRYTGSEQDLETGVAELRRRISRAYTLIDAHDSDEQHTQSHFEAGRTAFLRHWPSAYGPLHRKFSERELGVVALPGKAVLGGQNLAVTSSSPYAREAADLIKFITDPDSQRCLLDAGFAATRESAYLDDSLVCGHVDARDTSASASPSTGSPSPSPSGEGADRTPRDAAGRPRYARDVLLPALRNGVERPRTPLYGPFTQILTDTLQPLFEDEPQSGEEPSDVELASLLDAKLRDAMSG